MKNSFLLSWFHHGEIAPPFVLVVAFCVNSLRRVESGVTGRLFVIVQLR